jgi:hypothetical protein
MHHSLSCFFVHEYMVCGRNFYQPTPDVEVVTSGWQEWMLNEGVANEEDNGSFTFNHEASILGPPAGQSLNAQMSPTTHWQVASTSGSQTVIMPPTADLVEELMAYQHTMPSWKVWAAWQREAMDSEGTVEENTQKYVENISVELAE